MNNHRLNLPTQSSTPAIWNSTWYLIFCICLFYSFDFLTIWKRLIVIVVLVFFFFLVLVGLGPGRGNYWWTIANLGLHVGQLVSLQSSDGGPIIWLKKKELCMIKASICTGAYTCQAGLAKSSPRGLDSSWALRPTRIENRFIKQSGTPGKNGCLVGHKTRLESVPWRLDLPTPTNKAFFMFVEWRQELSTSDCTWTSTKVIPSHWNSGI